MEKEIEILRKHFVGFKASDGETMTNEEFERGLKHGYVSAIIPAMQENAEYWQKKCNEYKNDLYVANMKHDLLEERADSFVKRLQVILDSLITNKLLSVLAGKIENAIKEFKRK